MQVDQTNSQQLKELISSKKFEEVEELINKSQQKSDNLHALLEIYREIQFLDEEEYEQFLYLLVSTLTPQDDYELFKDTIGAILHQIVGLTSLKYTIVILGSFLVKIQHQNYSIFAILTNLHIFSPLLFDHTFDNVKNLYFSFRNARKQVLSEYKTAQHHIKNQINQITVESLNKIIQSVKKYSYEVNKEKIQEVLQFLSDIFKDYMHLVSKISEKQALEVRQLNYPLLLIEKVQVVPTNVALPIPFAVSFLEQYCGEDSLSSSIYSKTFIAKIILKTICLELSESTDSPPQFNNFYNKYLLKFIQRLSNFLNEYEDKEKNDFIFQNYLKIEQLIEKINIFIGAINPQQPSSRNIIKNFIPLSFLSPENKQKVLSKLIIKHTNLNFKTHLISQYRKLLTFKSSKKIWIRSTDLLFKQLKQIEPKTSIDYIGHILSFTYYWKGVTERFLKDQSFKRKLYFNIDDLLKDLSEKLFNLKKGLEAKVKLTESTISEPQRNEINVCLFRIDELLSSESPFETSKGK